MLYMWFVECMESGKFAYQVRRSCEFTVPRSSPVVTRYRMDAGFGPLRNQLVPSVDSVPNQWCSW
jgi:hypothetical protein